MLLRVESFHEETDESEGVQEKDRENDHDEIIGVVPLQTKTSGSPRDEILRISGTEKTPSSVSVDVSMCSTSHSEVP